MCKALKPCQKGSGQDCKGCFRYGSRVFSPDDSFRFKGKLCDCIVFLFDAYEVAPSRKALAMRILKRNGAQIKTLKTVKDGLCEYFSM